MMPWEGVVALFICYTVRSDLSHPFLSCVMLSLDGSRIYALD